MRVLAFSDVHADTEACRDLAQRSERADLVVAAGDFAIRHDGLEPTLKALAAITKPAAVVPGNNETEEALRAAAPAHWPNASVLHAEVAEVGKARIAALGGGVPPTGKDWSFDLTEDEAGERLGRLREALAGARLDILVTHSPPLGACDEIARGQHTGSRAISEAIPLLRPRLVVCGHVHPAWRQHAWVGSTLVYNAGPLGALIDLGPKSIILSRPHTGPLSGTGQTAWLDDVVVLKIPHA